MPLSLKVLIAACSCLLTIAHAQPIYRVIDENGNVTYTDQKPSDEAEPLDLPDISVISSTTRLPETAVAEPSEPSAVQPFQMRIVEPIAGSIIANAEGRIDLRLESNLDIPPAAEIVVLLNDQPQPPIRDLELSLVELPPGEYQLKAHLQSPSGRKLAESQTVSVQLVGADPG